MEWISVKERLPEKNMKVKWLCDDNIEDFGFYYYAQKSFATIDRLSSKPITHWKPLHNL